MYGWFLYDLDLITGRVTGISPQLSLSEAEHAIWCLRQFRRKGASLVQFAAQEGKA